MFRYRFIIPSLKIYNIFFCLRTELESGGNDDSDVEGEWGAAAAALFCITVWAPLQVSEEALKKRYDQGWLQEFTDDLDVLIKRTREARAKKEVSWG